MNKYRITGLLYLIIAIIGPFSILYVPSVILRESAIETYNQLQSNLGLFKMGIIADVLVILLELILITFLYKIFKPINIRNTVTAIAFRLGMIIIMLVNVGLLITILSSNAQSVQSLFTLHEKLTLAWGIVFGGHLLVLSDLIHKHERMPKYLPYLLIVGAIGYIFDGLGAFGVTLLFSMLPLMIGVIGEFWFMFWLIIQKEKAAH